MLLSLYLWHTCHNLDFIKTHQSDATELIPHINLVALTSHITFRSCRNIHLSCFGVNCFPCLMLHLWWFLCFALYEHYLFDLNEWLQSFWYILACNSILSVFINISLLLHAWNCFSRMVIDSVTRLTHMHGVPFSESIIHHLHKRSFTYAYT